MKALNNVMALVHENHGMTLNGTAAESRILEVRCCVSLMGSTCRNQTSGSRDSRPVQKMNLSAI
jgi:hypothetical protein